MIPPDILDQFDVELISYSKGDLIFQEGQRPRLLLSNTIGRG